MCGYANVQIMEANFQTHYVISSVARNLYERTSKAHKITPVGRDNTAVKHVLFHVNVKQMKQVKQGFLILF